MKKKESNLQYKLPMSLVLTVLGLFLTCSLKAEESGPQKIEFGSFFQTNPSSNFREIADGGVQGELWLDNSEEFITVTRKKKSPVFLISKLPSKTPYTAPLLTYPEYKTFPPPKYALAFDTSTEFQQIIEKQKLPLRTWIFLHDQRMMNRIREAMNRGVSFGILDSEYCSSGMAAVTWGPSTELGKSWGLATGRDSKFIILTQCASDLELAHELYHIEQFTQKKSDETGLSKFESAKLQLSQLSRDYNFQDWGLMAIWEALREGPAYLYQHDQMVRDSREVAWLYSQELKSVIKVDKATYNAIASPIMENQIKSALYQAVRFVLYQADAGATESSEAVRRLLYENIQYPGYNDGNGPLALNETFKEIARQIESNKYQAAKSKK